MVVATASGIISLVLTSLLGNLATPALAWWIKFTLFYLPKKAAFVIGGALTAPRHHLITSLILAAIASIMSLVVHILGQRTVGLTNYTHFTAETTGAALGAICIAVAFRPKPPSPLPLGDG